MADYKVYIDGAAGTTGLQIRDRLSALADIEILSVEEERRKDLDTRIEAVAKADVSVLCLPDEAAKEIVKAAPKDAKICDASTAHRVDDGWVYGFAELGSRRKKIKNAKRVSVPGCHSSGFLALVAPLVETGVISPALQLSCYSLTGYSGGGKQMIAAYEDEERPVSYDAPRMYGLSLHHKHLPEMQKIADLKHPPIFMPVVSDYYRGMQVSVPLPASLVAEQWRSPGRLAALYQDYYRNEALINVKALAAVPKDGMLSACEMAARDDMELFVLGNEQQLLLVARFDNLGKGAAGAAMQCINLMLGRKETDGLYL